MSQKQEPDFVLPNKRNWATGTFQGTWSGYVIRVSGIITFQVGKRTRGINVPVTLKITEEKIEVYT